MFGRKPPRKLRPPLARGEQVLAWARAVDDPTQVVVVTSLGLWLPGRARLGWHEIHKATWSGSRLTVVPAVAVGDGVGRYVPPVLPGTDESADIDETVSSNGVRIGPPYTVMADDAAVTVALGDPGDVPAAVRQRVTKSVAYTEHHPLQAGGVRVVARRVAGVDGLSWHVRYDPGTDTADPDVSITTAALVAAAATPHD